MSLQGVLKHVRVLEEAELVETRKEGRTRICRLSPRPLDELAEWVTRRQQRWNTLLDQYAAHLAERQVSE